MKQDLTSLLQAAPFTVKTRDGKQYNIEAVGQMCVGEDICAYVEADGGLVAIPFLNIDRVVIADPNNCGSRQG
jgi:hypothetical protein